MGFQNTPTNDFDGLTFDNCPTASFTTANNNVSTSTPVQFINQSTGASSFYWEFGDGNTSSVENPAHTYENSGTYTVKLRAIVDGCSVEFIGTEDIIIN